MLVLWAIYLRAWFFLKIDQFFFILAKHKFWHKVNVPITPWSTGRFYFRRDTKLSHDICEQIRECGFQPFTNIPQLHPLLVCHRSFRRYPNRLVHSLSSFPENLCFHIKLTYWYSRYILSRYASCLTLIFSYAAVIYNPPTKTFKIHWTTSRCWKSCVSCVLPELPTSLNF